MKRRLNKRSKAEVEACIEQGREEREEREKNRHRIELFVDFRGDIVPVMFGFTNTDHEFVDRIRHAVDEHNTRITWDGDLDVTRGDEEVVFGSEDVDLSNDYTGHYLGVYIGMFEREYANEHAWLMNEAIKLMQSFIKADRVDRASASRHKNTRDQRSKALQYHDRHRAEFASRIALVRHMIKHNIVIASERTLNEKWFKGLK